MSQTNTRKALGKGLEQLFESEQMDFKTFEQEIVSTTPESDILQIPIEEIRSNPYQPRIHFDKDALEELAESIRLHGVFEPIIVKKSIKGYELVAGERRTKAAKIAGLERIPAIVKDFSDQDMMEIALLENIQRENLSPIEEAKAYKNFMTKMNMTQEELGTRFGKSRSYITNILGLLNLPKEVQQDVMENKISMSHARVLSKIEDEDKIIELNNLIKNKGISVRELESISSGSDIQKRKTIVRNTQSDSIKSKIYEKELRDLIGSKVMISKNKITIPYATLADLDRIMEILNIEIGE
ncbi:MAG: ParB/RepB/Spo0J family partition protein [Bacilli bacterium]|nr:ParB/RepB/Spo0J family partition protein [Bacilli bacterium]